MCRNYLRGFFGTKKNMLTFWWGLVAFAKIIRYTILKKTLVDAGIGHKMLPYIVEGVSVFTWFDSGESSGANGNAVWFFEKTNLLGLNSYVSFEILITIIWNAVFMIIVSKCKKRYDSLQTMFLIVLILALNIFDLTLAKEPIQILFFVGIFYCIYKKENINYCLLMASVFIAASTLTYRNYYILLLGWMLCIAFIYKFVNNKKLTISRAVFLVLLIGCFYILMMYTARVISPSIYSELIRVRTRPSTATTEIKSIIKSDNLILFALNYILIIVRMLFPIELVRFGIKYFIYVIVQFVISLVVLNSIKNIRFMENNERVSLYVVIAFVLMSGFFEPDFGSWIRHEVALFPMFLIVGGFLDNKKQE